MPNEDANASRYQPVQRVNGRVIRECCEPFGSTCLSVFHILGK